MYICIGTHRINVDQIKAYGVSPDKDCLHIKFMDVSSFTFRKKDYDLDVVILELDRVCNPKVLKGKLDEK